MATENKHRAKGTAQQVGGKIEKAAGQLTGNREMEDRGRARETEGKVRKEGAKAVGKARGAAQQAGGKVKKAAGKVTDDERLEAEGELQDAEGKARREANR